MKSFSCRPIAALLTVGVLSCRAAPLAVLNEATPGATVQVRQPLTGQTLRAVSEFKAISPLENRSKALFLEATRVMLHPRCSNCHPNGESPFQGIDQHLHQPPVTRGPEDHGVVGMQCGTCHQLKNQELARVPGAPKWGVAPLEMAWVGKTPQQLCEQVKDPARNGGKTLEQILEHSAHDELVAWGWAPGPTREPAPGTQAQFGALIEAWIQTGAHCPGERAP